MIGRSHSMVWAIGTLRRQGMPLDEIRGLLGADDRSTVHRYLELHRERLEERVAEQERRLASIECLLDELIAERGSIAQRAGSR